MSRGVAGSAYFEWNYPSSIIIKHKGFGTDLNRYFAQLVFDYSYNFTPYDPFRTEGAHMADNVRIFANDNYGRIIYQSKYARLQHDNKYQHNLMIHPLATDHWEQAAWRQHSSEILADLDVFRKSRSV